MATDSLDSRRRAPGTRGRHRAYGSPAAARPRRRAAPVVEPHAPDHRPQPRGPRRASRQLPLPQPVPAGADRGAGREPADPRRDHRRRHRRVCHRRDRQHHPRPRPAPAVAGRRELGVAATTSLRRSSSPSTRSGSRRCFGASSRRRARAHGSSTAKARSFLIPVPFTRAATSCASTSRRSPPTIRA